MKRMRIILIGAGLLLVGWALYWLGAGARPRPEDPAAPRSSTVSETSNARASRPAGGKTDGTRSVLPQPPTSQPELPETQMLRDVITGIEGIHSEADPLKRSEKRDQLARSIAPADLPEVLGLLWKKDLSPDGQELRLQLAQRWAETSPRDAAEFIAKQKPGLARQESLDRVVTAWAEQDFGAAVAWARQLAEPTDQQNSLMAIAYETARTAPLEAMKLAVGLPPSESRDDLLTHAANQWAGNEPRTAASWVSQIEDPDLRERLLASVVTTWSDQNAVEAAEFGLQSVSPGEQQDRLIVGVVQRWAQTEPRQAADWVARFPEGALRDTAIENLISLWVDRSFEQAGDWLNGLAPGAVRDAGVGALVSRTLPIAPDVAAEWAAEISDADRRANQMESVAESWLVSDPDAARAWITQSPLPDEVKARLLSPRANPPSEPGESEAP